MKPVIDQRMIENYQKHAMSELGLATATGESAWKEDVQNNLNAAEKICSQQYCNKKLGYYKK